MTPNEITTTIALKYGKALDMPFKLAMMKRVDAWRSRHVRNTLERDKKDRKFFIQTIYVPLHKEKELECDLPITLCDVAVSDKLPNPLRANNILFDFVGGINGTNPIYNATAGIMIYMRHGKYTGHRLSYDWINNKLVILGNPDLPMVRVSAVWDDPTAVIPFTCKTNTDITNEDCDYWNQEYPASYEIIQQVIQTIEQVDFKEKNVVNLQSEIEVPVNPKTDE